MTQKPKNFRLRDLHIDSELLNLLNRIAEQLNISNTTLARTILEQKLKEFQSMDIQTLSFAIVGQELPQKSQKQSRNNVIDDRKEVISGK